mmetsp:Transcript_42214/g.98989  ORF Transcript_42214/g.98989 Transcript_42214/m.98989 type:complete len:95 (+) Transcript_42214:236-520(+)
MAGPTSTLIPKTADEHSVPGAVTSESSSADSLSVFETLSSSMNGNADDGNVKDKVDDAPVVIDAAKAIELKDKGNVALAQYHFNEVGGGLVGMG